jgi:hypothetical protein
MTTEPSDPVTSREPVTSDGARNVTPATPPAQNRNGVPLTNAQRQAAYRQRQREKRHNQAPGPAPEVGPTVTTNVIKLRRPKRGGHKKDPDAPKQPVAPTPKLHAPPRSRNLPITDFDPEIVDTLLWRMEHGETLRQICQTEGFPSAPAVIGWVHEDPAGFGERYARARDRQLEAWADEIVATADAAVADPMSANGRRLAVDVRKWLLARLKPEKYGDRIDARLANPDGTPLRSAGDLDLAKALLAALPQLLPAPVPMALDAEATPVEPVSEEGDPS